MLRDSRDPLVKKAHRFVITGRKWKAKIAVENAALKMKEIIGTGKWKSRSWPSSTALVVQGIHNKQKKNAFEKIHHLKQVGRIAIGVG